MPPVHKLLHITLDTTHRHEDGVKVNQIHEGAHEVIEPVPLYLLQHKEELCFKLNKEGLEHGYLEEKVGPDFSSPTIYLFIDFDVVFAAVANALEEAVDAGGS